MVAENLPAALDETWGHEGGLSLDPNDRGNWTGGKKGVGELKGTKYGIAAHAYPYLDIRNLTRAAAAQFYRQDYWNRVWGDDLPSGPDVVTFDGAINSGPGRSIKWLQGAIGTKADGGFGPKTMAAVEAVTDWPAAIKRMTAKRLSFLQGLTSLFKRYGRGWTVRVARVEAFGLGLALLALGRSPASISTVVEIEAETADQSRRRDNQKASGAGGVAAVDGTVAATGGEAADAPVPQTDCTPTDRPDLAAIPADGFPWLELLLWGVLAAALVAAAYFLWRAHGQKMRVTALRSLANSQKGQT